MRDETPTAKSCVRMIQKSVKSLQVRRRAEGTKAKA